MALAALAAYLLLLWLAFGVRAIRQRRATGDSGFRGSSEPLGSPGWWGAMLLVVAVVLALVGLALAVLGLVPVIDLPFAVTVLGALVVLAGAALVLWSQALVPSWPLLASLVALALGVHLQVRHVEEPYLLRVQGENYRRYAARVGRFLPGLGRLTP